MKQQDRRPTLIPATTTHDTREGSVAEFEAASDKEAAQRRCIASNKVLPKEELLRFVVGPSNQVTIDLDEKLPGRGVWCRADAKTLQQAISKNLFAKSAKQSVVIPDNFLAIIEQRLVQKIVDLISLSRRSGQAVAGFETVRNFLRDQKAAFIFIASDCAQDSQQKILKLAQAVGTPLTIRLTSTELGKAFGQDQFMFVAVSSENLSHRLEQLANYLQNIR